MTNQIENGTTTGFLPEPSEKHLIGDSEIIATQAYVFAIDFLGAHSDLVSDDVIGQIADRNSEVARQQYLAQRREGKINDTQNYDNPGLTAYVTQIGLNGIKEVCKKHGYPILEDQIAQVTPELSALTLPSGVYSAGFGGLQFYQKMKSNDDPTVRIGESLGVGAFALPYKDVIRIDGSNGELWQNYHYNLDGTPKNPQSE